MSEHETRRDHSTNTAPASGLQPLVAWIVGALWRIGAIVIDVFESCVLLYDVIWKARDDSSALYRRLRRVGFFMLAVALALCMGDWGLDVGVAVWLACVSASTLFVALMLMPLSRWSLSVIPHATVLVLTAVCVWLF
ncbi:MAG TPA: DUF3325 domain-containing protein [Povalibacter sp.]|uniref:DUF3325 domain-containing protein n=1 Tax=Povalibacter sp. TaxID=1962978 RepID=UPI002BA7750E|nr:DUF3325 domain-containing protein [Povalibacter sp.]HMN43769.1 DUF3325 domain-containing protein [Povalibacter sp.]